MTRIRRYARTAVHSTAFVSWLAMNAACLITAAMMVFFR